MKVYGNIYIYLPCPPHLGHFTSFIHKVPAVSPCKSVVFRSSIDNKGEIEHEIEHQFFLNYRGNKHDTKINMKQNERGNKHATK
jgi:hypothetical protein